MRAALRPSRLTARTVAGAALGGWMPLSQRRWGASNEDPKSVETMGGSNLVKSASTLAVENREQKIFTMEQYVERDQAHNDFGDRTAKLDAQRRMDSPIWLLYSLLFMTAGSLYVVMCVRLRHEKKRFDPKMRQVHMLDMEGGPSIGGPFELETLDGVKVTNESFKGKWLYIYFGFTNCPDICPQEMSKMTRVITQLDKKVGADFWQPLFISIDPKRDTKEVLKEYLKDFHPRIMGLVGTPEQVEKAAREYRVYFAVPDEFGDSPDYLIDHSIIMYIMDPEGKFSDYTTKEFTWFESYNKLLRRMIQLERAKPTDRADFNPDVANLDTFHLKHQLAKTGQGAQSAA
jgi:protein SCO1/2